MEKTKFITTTSTYAHKGKNALIREGIENEIKRTSGGTASGCLYGIYVNSLNASKARKILFEENIKIISESVVTV